MNSMYIVTIKNKEEWWGWNDWEEEDYKSARKTKEFLESHNFEGIIIKKV